MAQRIGLYGGSFDPIHHGHLIVARAIGEKLELDSVIFLPSALPPHKETVELAEASHRAEMVRLAIQGESLFEVSDFDLLRAGPSYTIDTVGHFRKRFGPKTELFWMIGADSLAELVTWHRVRELVDACRIVTAARPDSIRIRWDEFRGILAESQIKALRDGVLETPRIEISSTDIRRRIRQGRSVRYLLHDNVRDYVAKHRLYGTP